MDHQKISIWLKYSFILLTGVITACDFEVSYSVDSRIQPYVDKFYYEAGQRGVALRTDNLSVHVIDLDRFGRTIKDRSVYIDSDVVNLYSSDYSEELEVIVFHELGHALLHRGHTTDPSSIMQEDACITCYKNNIQIRSKYLNELFQGL